MGDAPEAQLTALDQMATGAGLTVSGYPGADIAPGQQALWRPSSLKIAIIFTDASFHRPGDLGGPIPYPGPNFSTTIGDLISHSIKVIGIRTLGWWRIYL